MKGEGFAFFRWHELWHAVCVGKGIVHEQCLWLWKTGRRR